jgi:glycosyltransferase involved in cell wall biosynthesis
MRLLLVDREFPPNPHGGIGSYNLALARGLGQMGHFVVVLSCTAGGDPTQTDEPYGVLVRIPYRPPGGILPRSLRWIDAIVLGQRLTPYAIRLTERFELDLLEVPSAGGYAYFLARSIRDRIPVVTRFHGAQGKVPIDDMAGAALSAELARVGYGRVRRLLAGILNTPLWHLERGQMRFSHRVTCPSEFSQDWLRREIGPAGPSLLVIRNGLYLNGSHLRDSAAAEPRPARAKTLTFVGRCSVPKGATVLARAVPRLLSKDLETTVVFVGPFVDPRTARILLALADRHPGRVKMKGRLPHSQVLGLLADSYALVAPSFYEICPMAVLEAMALGTPVVAANAGPIPEIVEDRVSGLLFQPGDAEALARSLLALLDSPGRRLEMAVACRSRFAALYDMQIVMEQIEAFYEGISQGGM